MSNYELVGNRNDQVLTISAFNNKQREGMIIMSFAKIPTVAWLQYLKFESLEMIKRKDVGTLLIYKSLQDAPKLGFEELQGNFSPIPNNKEGKEATSFFYEYLGIELTDDQKTLIARIPAVIARCEEIIDLKELKFTYREVK